MVIAWSTQVHRFGPAFLQLEKVGLDHETHPLVRSALEYTIVGHWAAAVGDNAVIAQYTEDQRRLKALIKDLEATPDDVMPTQWKAEMFADHVAESPLRAVNETKFIKTFDRICRDIGVHNTLYPVYRTLSWITHPTTHGALVYLAGDRQLRDEPQFLRPLGYVGLMTYAVFWSRRTVDDLTVNHPYREWLEEIAQSIGVLTRLPPPRSITGKGEI
jgi:hypothetical protein